MFRWILSKLLRRKYITGVDTSNGKDYTCEMSGYVDKNNVIHITSCKYTEGGGEDESSNDSRS